MPENNISDLKLRFLGSLVEQLGAQMYPSVTSTIAELISNAWDADARNVWITIPFETLREEGEKIVVVDDGLGMTYEEARDRYLIVGRKRRVALGRDKSKEGRPLHGRKGIGKLAAFGTAKTLECHTLAKNTNTTVRFRLDYDKIRQEGAGSDYQVEPPIIAGDPITDPNGNNLEHGTRIVLSDLKLKRNISKKVFQQSMSRRFALDTGTMNIYLNNSQIERFDYPVEFRFPQDGAPEGVSIKDQWAEDSIDSGNSADSKPVKWWIGFTEQPLKDQSLQGISVLARGKMVQRPFMFQRAQGLTGQLGQEYLIGEVQADWLDEGNDIEQDRIQANRDQLQLEDEELDAFVRWGQGLLKWALQTRNDLRKDKVEEDLNELLSELLDQLSPLEQQLTPLEQRQMRRVVKAISMIQELDIKEGKKLVQSVVDSRSDSIVRSLLENIDSKEPDFQTEVWNIIRQFGLIDARRNQTIIEARLKAIEELQRFIHEGAREVPTIHRHIKKYPWLIDPRWNLFGEEIDLRKLGISSEPSEPDPGRVDFVFALGPSQPDTHDELLLVEIKRATDSDGKQHAVSRDEVNTFIGYAQDIQEKYSYRITALMVAQRYTQEAQKARSLTMDGVIFLYRTWDQVLLETERLHRGWLTITQRHAKYEESNP